MSDDEKAALFADGAVTTVELKQRFGIGKTTAYELMGSGELPYTHLGRLRLIPVRAVTALLAKGLVTTPGE